MTFMNSLISSLMFTGGDTDSEVGVGDRDNDSLASFLSSVHGLTSAPGLDMDLR